MLSISKSKLSLNIKNSQNLFLSSFPSFITLGTTKRGFYLKHKHVKIYTRDYEIFLNNYLDGFSFFGSNDIVNLKKDSLLFDKLYYSELILNNNKFIKYSLKFENNIETTFCFDSVEYLDFIKAFRNLIFSSLRFSTKECFFSIVILKHCQLKEDLINFEKNPFILMNFLKNYQKENFNSKENEKDIENFYFLFSFHYDLFLILFDIEKLL